METVMGILTCIGICLIPALVIICCEAEDQSNLYNWMPLKFGVRKVERSGGEQKYRLYFKRLLFWHKYMDDFYYYFGQFEGTEPEIWSEINKIMNTRENIRKCRKNSHKKNKIIRIK